MSKLALHWKILIGLVFGLLVGIVVNVSWDAGTWRSLGVDDAASYMAEGRPEVPEDVDLSRMSDQEIAEAYPNARAGLGAGAAKFVRQLTDFVGKLFIRLLRFIAVPIVLFSLIVGAASLNDLRKLGRIGGKTVVLYLCTTALAITIGLLLANWVKPGGFVSETVREELKAGQLARAEASLQSAAAPNPWETALNVVPQNPFAALAQTEMLQIVFTALVVGIALTLIPKEKSGPILAFFDGMTDVVIKLVHIVLKMAPVAVFALIAIVVADMGMEVLQALVVYSVVVVAGLVVMIFGVYPLAMKVFTKGAMGYGRFFKGIAPAQLLAFSSSSSGATLPVTMECAEENLGVGEEVSSFVLPLGATVNMDGTALYQGVATLFIAQMFDVPLSLGAQLTIVLMATLASIGTAAVPSAGIIMLVIVLESVKMPAEMMATGIAVIFGVDRILDMCRTTCNVTGDLMVATVVASTEGDLASVEEVARRKARAEAVGLDEYPKET